MPARVVSLAAPTALAALTTVVLVASSLALPARAQAQAQAQAPAPAPASAQRWDQGEQGRQRRAHLIFTVGLGSAFLASELFFKSALAPDECRWCQPPGFDADTRDALVWGDAKAARFFSDVTAYAALPILALGTSLAPALHRGTSGAEILDATVPIVESVVISQSLAQIVKFAVGRQRPYAHFDGEPVAIADDDNLSFFSGHSSFAFSLVASTATLARLRGWRAEPVIWAVGVPLAAATGYLRIAGDKHYLSDVVVGAAVGTATGLLVPRWYRYELAVVPTGNGAAVVGRF